jgi:PiT family inorganic phosphate transporter
MKSGLGIVRGIQAFLMGSPSGYAKTALVSGPAPGATALGQRGLIRAGLGAMFLLAAAAFASLQDIPFDTGPIIIVAAVIGGYMALNIGANDVANNVGPAVGSKALTMAGALLIATVFEAAGAILAGGDVVATISKGIIDPSLMPDHMTFVWAMMSALLAAALWLNLATWVGAPISTTHSIVGGVMGAGIVATGTGAVDWGTMSMITASWVISPLLGGVIAALFLALLRAVIFSRQDKLAAARRWVPVFVAVMASVFSMYLAMKGFQKIWRPGPGLVLLVGGAAFAAAYAIVRPLVARRSQSMANDRHQVRSLFVVPLICSAALLSFAHGANDVANAIGPLAAIVGTLATGGIDTTVGIPLWVMVIGAIGISVGLGLYGPKLIRTVGEQITILNPARAFCVALAAAITVIIASLMGLPVSSTHIAVGAVFGVGFFREVLTNWPRDNKRRLVRRKVLFTIAGAWVITVPAAALLAALLFNALIRFV